VCTLTDTTTLRPSHSPINNLCVSFSHFSYINKQIYYRVLRRITYMSKVARYQGSTVFCEMIRDILVRGRTMGRASRETSQDANLQAALWHHRNNQKYSSAFHTRKNFSETYPQYGHSLPGSLVLGQQCSKNIGLTRHQIINLLRTALALVQTY